VHKILYCGVTNNPHDKRFIKALQELGAVETYFKSLNTKPTLELYKYDAIVVGPLTVSLDFLNPDLDVPIIGMSHAFDINETDRNSSDYESLVVNCERFSRIICDNPYIKEVIENEFKPKIKIDIIPYGCDLSKLIKLKPNLGGGIKLLSMRNWTTIHSNDKIIDALSILSDRDIIENAIFIGDGPELQEGISNFQHSNSRVPTEFRGFVGSDALTLAMAESNVYVSSSRSDGSSVSLMEAMAAGLIPCVTDHESNLRIITNGVNGFVYRNQDSEALAETLVRIANLSEDSRNEISRNSRTYASEKFDWQSNREIFQQAILEAINA
jgi:glycosyltransferase involved in cell wall biosynthesis